jgi:hypothetical protein
MESREGRLMFDINDQVRCIDDSPDYFSGVAFPSGLVKGRIYTVQGFFREGEFVEEASYTLNADAIAIGVPDFWGADCHLAYRFRKVIPKDTREALATLIGLFDTTTTREGVSA